MVRLVESMDASHPAEPVVVISNRPDAGGLEKAQSLGVKTAVVDHRPFGTDRSAFEATLNAELRLHAPDIVCLAGFMRILTSEFTNAWIDCVLNIHPSLLPKYPGLDTHARALEAGDREAGCTVHLVTEDLDAGPILGQARVQVRSGDTPEILAVRVLDFEHQFIDKLSVFGDSAAA